MNRIAKRAFDIFVAVVLLPIAAPLCLLLLVAIRLESPGNPLFVQRRVGREQRIFRMFKLRTMRSDTHDLPSHEVGGAQITRLGAILRKLKLDELPQLVNILGGAMSLVGPRPCLPSQAQLIKEREQRGIFAYRPGVTGAAQVKGVDMSDPQLLAETEAEYLSRSSFYGDFLILLQTAFGHGQGDAATKISNDRGSL